MKDQPSDDKGRFVRPETQFRSWVKKGSEFSPEANRYHLYVSYACPWCHRAMIMRNIKGLQNTISMSKVASLLTHSGWKFGDDGEPDPIFNAKFMSEIYEKAKTGYVGRWTVPVLWDKRSETIVTNESRELIRMLDHEFSELANDVDLCPPDLKEDVYAVIDEIYETINNGVYKCGFAKTQEAYDEAVDVLFNTLDKYEQVLSKQRYVCGSRFTEADICLFVTLLRFDPVYVAHFKCNVRRIFDYPNLWNYVKEIYQMPDVKETCDMDHIKRHYFTSHKKVNAYGVIPKGPEIDFDEPHDRARFK